MTILEKENAFWEHLCVRYHVKFHYLMGNLPGLAIPILQMRKLRHQATKRLLQVHRAGQQTSGDSNLKLPSAPCVASLLLWLQWEYSAPLNLFPFPVWCNCRWETTFFFFLSCRGLGLTNLCMDSGGITPSLDPTVPPASPPALSSSTTETPSFQPAWRSGYQQGMKEPSAHAWSVRKIHISISTDVHSGDLSPWTEPPGTSHRALTWPFFPCNTVWNIS